MPVLSLSQGVPAGNAINTFTNFTEFCAGADALCDAEGAGAGWAKAVLQDSAIRVSETRANRSNELLVMDNAPTAAAFHKVGTDGGENKSLRRGDFLLSRDR